MFNYLYPSKQLNVEIFRYTHFVFLLQNEYPCMTHTLHVTQCYHVSQENLTTGGVQETQCQRIKLYCKVSGAFKQFYRQLCMCVWVGGGNGTSSCLAGWTLTSIDSCFL